MTDQQIIVALLVFTAVREMYYLYATHKLMNKVMSRNYGEYVQTEMLKKTKPVAPMTMDDAINVELQQQIDTLGGIL